MKIEAVKFVHPRKKMTNSDVIEIIRQESKDEFEEDLETALKSVGYMLESIGLRERYWMEDETPLELMIDAAQQAFEESGFSPEDIDVLIFCGIARGFLEPADSYFIAQALGMDKVDCFDVMDACMAWSRSCDIVESFFKAGRYQTALIINAENYFYKGGVSFPSNFKLRNYRSLEYCFGAYCGGDGAAATILSCDGEDWERHYISTKAGSDLCTIPLPGFEGRCSKTDLIALNGLGAFTSFSSRVFASYQHMIEILKMISHHFDEIKVIYAHTGGDINAYEKWAEKAGAAGKVKYLFSDYGNLGTVSMPASIALDVSSGNVNRGDKIGCWLGSSGMSFTSYVLTY
jgi:3-oxoacyl-[acyl-carrier-protein] synthase III